MFKQIIETITYTIFCSSVSFHEVVEKVKRSLEEIEASILTFKEKQKDVYVRSMYICVIIASYFQ